ncbi:hypothetical protein ACFE04_002036 [Oxalis oulophora]
MSCGIQSRTTLRILVDSSSSNLLRQCKSLVQAQLIHQQLIVHDTLHHNFPATQLIHAYITHNAPSHHALFLLQRLHPSPSTVYFWNLLIRHALRKGLCHRVLSFFRQMSTLGWNPDEYTYPFVLKACGHLPTGASLHGAVCANGFNSNVFVCNALVAMYGRCSALGDARNMFDEMNFTRVCDVVSWNSIVASYWQNGHPKTALNLFRRMTINQTSKSPMVPDAVSLVNVLPASAALCDSSRGKEIHGYAYRTGLFQDVFVANAAIDMYAKCGMIVEAIKVFEQMKDNKDVVSWNTMVTGYSQVGRFEDALALFQEMKQDNIKLNVIAWSAVIASYAQRGHGPEALDVFRQMQLSGSEPNVVTLVSLLSACAAIGTLLHGKQTHCYAIKSVLNLNMNDPGDDLMVINGLIDMYAKCKNINIARAMFESVAPKDRNVVTWTAMIGGYAQHGEANEALKLFSELFQQDEPLMPNAFTICCSLMACARLCAFRFGKQIHSYVLRNQYGSETVFVNNCIIDMYSKCGIVDAARIVFDNMQLKNPVSWTSLMNGYGLHGRGKEALEIFNDMRKTGFLPDAVTFVVVLYACSHSGMVDTGLKIFHGMSKEFGIIPGPEHYACVVDLLGRAGRLDQAKKLIQEMPVEPNLIVWIALLSGCRTHGNIELGEYAAKKLSELGVENDGIFTLLSNLYADARRWKDVARIRSSMKHSGIQKRPGCSWVEGKKGTVTFYVGDMTHPKTREIYDFLAETINRIKAIGYIPETSFALHDVDDEEKSDNLSEHSEKLALAYGILSSPSGATIRITKNLRVCGDCHNAFIYISKIIDHEIVLRDTSRFHHFKKGSCSCRGFW